MTTKTRNELLEEILTATEGGGGSDVETAWTRITDNYTATKKYEWLDVFPSANGKVITLPDPVAIGTTIRIDVYNQTNMGYSVILNDHLGAQIKSIDPAKSFSAFWRTDIGGWELVQTSGLAVPALDPVVYGNFDSANWSSLPTAIYKMSALGSQLSGFPSDYSFNPVSTYNFEIDFINETGVAFGQRVSFNTDSDFSNKDLARQINRIGLDLGSMITAPGWRVYPVKSEVTQVEFGHGEDSSLYNINDGAGFTAITGLSATVNVVDNTKETIEFEFFMPSIVGSNSSTVATIGFYVNGVQAATDDIPLRIEFVGGSSVIISAGSYTATGTVTFDIRVAATGGTVTVDNTVSNARVDLLRYRNY